MSVTVYDRLPNCIVVGEGAVRTIGDHLRKFGGLNNIAVVTDEGLMNLPIVTGLCGLLREQGYEPCLFGDVRSLPTDQNVLTTAEKMKLFDIEAVVAVGGGSAMDCARAANAIYSCGGTLEEHSSHRYAYSKSVLKPFIAIPTTAGTGSEVAAASGIIKTDPSTGKCSGFFVLSDPKLVPDVSIIDPSMSVGLSPAVTAATGMDVLTHAYEALVSPVDFPLATGLSLEAIHLVSDNLRIAVLQGGNIKVRENMAVAAATATLAFQLCGLGLVHGISEGLSAYTLIPHGTANGILLPPVMRFNAPCTPDLMVRAAAAFGINTFTLSKTESAEQVILHVESLIRDIGIPSTLSGYFTLREKEQPDVYRPLSREVVEQTVKTALKAHFLHTNPRQTSEADVRAILCQQFDGYKFSD